MSELKPCPFCGSTDLSTGHISSMRFAVSCDNCKSHGPVYGLPDYDEEGKGFEEWETILTESSIKAWNEQGQDPIKVYGWWDIEKILEDMKDGKFVTQIFHAASEKYESEYKMINREGKMVGKIPWDIWHFVLAQNSDNVNLDPMFGFKSRIWSYRTK